VFQSPSPTPHPLIETIVTKSPNARHRARATLLSVLQIVVCLARSARRAKTGGRDVRQQRLAGNRASRDPRDPNGSTGQATSFGSLGFQFARLPARPCCPTSCPLVLARRADRARKTTICRTLALLSVSFPTENSACVLIHIRMISSSFPLSDTPFAKCKATFRS